MGQVTTSAIARSVPTVFIDAAVHAISTREIPRHRSAGETVPAESRRKTDGWRLAVCMQLMLAEMPASAAGGYDRATNQYAPEIVKLLSGNTAAAAGTLLA